MNQSAVEKIPDTGARRGVETSCKNFVNIKVAKLNAECRYCCQEHFISSNDVYSCVVGYSVEGSARRCMGDWDDYVFMQNPINTFVPGGCIFSSSSNIFHIFPWELIFLANIFFIFQR